ncbi:MAG TPA: hypothetical protein VMH28_29975, partial [Candidatus Acidoferrales bacterium]|nr:hypothetical protein [Candidatus Acidoferrales bacterium]
LGISLFYWICAGARAAYQPFWYDELATWHIARMPTVAAMWAANTGGVDINVLLSHLCVRLSHALFGTGHLSTRLPALCGFWILMLSLYVFLRRRLPLPYALIGMIFPMLTFAWAFAFEARAYGIVLGCTGVALVAWQNVADGRMRRTSLAAIAISMAVALACHPFTVLLAIPFGLAEAVRSLEMRRIDLPVWIAFAAGTPLMLLYPMILAPMHGIDMHQLQPTYSTLPSFYDAAFRTAITPLLGAGAAAYLLLRASRGARNESEAKPVFSWHESAALLGFAISPAILISVMIFSTTMMFFPRYGLISVIGAAGLLALLLFRVSGGSRRAGWVMLTVLMAWLVTARGREAASGIDDPRAQFEERTPILLKALADGRPVLMSDPVLFVESDFYVPESAAGRLTYVELDRAFRRRYRNQDFSDQLIAYFSKYVPFRVHVESWESYSRRNPQFLFHAHGGYQCLYDVLLQGGWKLTLISQSNEESLYEVTAPAKL